MKLLIAIMCLAFLTGCATQGRFSLIDLDFRSAEQSVAQQPENTMMHSAVTTVQPQPKAITPLSVIFDFLEVVKGRIRIITCEWK